MVSENTINVQLDIAGLDKFIKAADQLEKGMGKTAQDLKSAVVDMGKRAGSSFMEYSKATDEEKKNLPGGRGKAEKAGQMASKMMLGEKGFGGLKKSMVGMAVQNIPMGKAFAAGGAAGVAMAALGGILGIVKKALGQSSILNTVAKSFWTIMGTMADIVLMPMLPYMFKFLQWMMTTVMPWVLNLSEAVSALLKGDMGPLYEIWWKLLWDVGVALITKLVPFLLKLPGMMLEGMGKAAWSMLGFHQGGVVGVKSYHDGGTVPGGPQSEELALLQGGETVIPRMDTAKQSVQGWFGDTASLIEKTVGKLTRWTDEDIRKEGSTGGFWQRWYDSMVGQSILPESKQGVQGWFGEMESESKSLKDRLFGWIGDNSVTNFFKNIFGSITGALSSLWGGKTESGEEGYEGEPGGKPQYKGIWGFLQWLKDQIPSWSSIKEGLAGVGSGLAKFGSWVWKKISDLWGGKHSPGDPGHSGDEGSGIEYPGIYGKVLWILSKIPSWDSIKDQLAGIGGSLVDFGTWVWEKLTAIWGKWQAEGGGIRGWVYDNIWEKVPSWDKIKEAFGTFGSGMANLGSLIWSNISGVWGEWRAEGSGVRGWVHDNIWSKVPSWYSIKKAFGTFGAGMANLGALIWSSITDMWGEWKSPDGGGIRGWIHENIWDKVPSWKKIKKSFGSLVDTFKDWGSTIWNQLKDIWGNSPTDDSYDGTEHVPGVAGKGIRGWISTHITSKIPSWAKIKGAFKGLVGGFLTWGQDQWDKLKGIWGNAPVEASGHGGEAVAAVGGNGLLGWISEHITSKIPTWTSVKDKFKDFVAGMIDIGGTIKTWLGNIWGKWDKGGGGIRGWIYDHTVDKLPSMDDMLQVIAKSLDRLGMLKDPYYSQNTGDILLWSVKLKGVGDIFKDIGSAIGDAFDWLKEKLTGMIPDWMSFDISFPSISDLTGWIKGVIIGVRRKFADALDSSVVQAVMGWASNIPFLGSQLDKLQGWVDKYKSGGQAYFGFATGTYKGYDYAKKAYMYYPGFSTSGTPGARGTLRPGFQKGGIVPGPIGAPVVATVHGGEMIIPAGATNNNNNQKVFNIQINSNLSAADIVRDIDWIDSMNTSAYSTVLG